MHLLLGQRRVLIERLDGHCLARVWQEEAYKWAFLRKERICNCMLATHELWCVLGPTLRYKVLQRHSSLNPSHFDLERKHPCTDHAFHLLAVPLHHQLHVVPAQLHRDSDLRLHLASFREWLHLLRIFALDLQEMQARHRRGRNCQKAVRCRGWRHWPRPRREPKWFLVW